MCGFMPTSHQVRGGNVVFHVTNRIQFVHGLTSRQNIRIVSTDLHHPNFWCSKTSHAITEGNFSSNINNNKKYIHYKDTDLYHTYTVYILSTLPSNWVLHTRISSSFDNIRLKFLLTWCSFQMNNKWEVLLVN